MERDGVSGKNGTGTLRPRRPGMENASDPLTGRLRSANGDSAEVTQTETHREKRKGRRGGARRRTVGTVSNRPTETRLEPQEEKGAGGGQKILEEKWPKIFQD